MQTTSSAFSECFCRAEFAGGNLQAAQDVMMTALAGPSIQDLGKGSIGTVKQFMSGAQWVVKTVVLKDVATLKRACIEAHVARQLQHEHLPRYVACVANEAATQLHLVMQAAPGLTSLLQVLRATGPLSEARTQTITRQLVRALDYLHTHHGLVYADLKAENVLVHGDNHYVQLIDFDLCMPLLGSAQYPSVPQSTSTSGSTHTASTGQPALAASSPANTSAASDSKQPPTSAGAGQSMSTGAQGAGAGAVLPLPKHLWLCTPAADRTGLGQAEEEGDAPHFWGTLEYVAPEVIQRGAAACSAASDWWALGVLVYEMLFGHTPFEGPTQERTVYNITMRAPMYPASPQVSQRCQDFIRSLLRHNTTYRLGVKGAQEILEQRWLADNA